MSNSIDTAINTLQSHLRGRAGDESTRLLVALDSYKAARDNEETDKVVGRIYEQARNRAYDSHGFNRYLWDGLTEKDKTKYREFFRLTMKHAQGR